jgi:hypothetical protein
MKNDLSEASRGELRRVLGEMESLAPFAPELETPTLDVQPQGRSGPNPLLVALGTAVAVFALALPAILQSPSPGTTDGAGSTPETSPAATPTSSPNSSTVPGGEGWAITEVGLGTVLEVTDAGFLAVTSNEVQNSDDGTNWQHLASLDDGIYLFDIEHRGDTVVGAGGGLVDVEAGVAPPTAVWTSLDGGATWTHTEIGSVSDITSTPDGFAAVGVERDDSDPGYNKTRGVLWTSSDGLSWTQVAASDDPAGVSSNFRTVVWDGQLLILGDRGADYVSEGSGLDDPPPHDNVTWFSDGTNLTDPSPSTLGGYIDEDSAAATPYGIIALTHWSTPTVKTDAAAWISHDGINWTVLEVPPGYEYTDVAQSGEDVMISGYEILDAQDDGIDTGVWTSSDGAQWTRIELPKLSDGTRIEQVEVSETAIVIAGDQSAKGVIAGIARS